MDKLPKDIILKLTEELSPQDFVSFCASHTSQNVIKACNMEEIWDKRLKKDFPFFSMFNKVINKKELYLGTFSRLSKLSETLTQLVLDDYGKDIQRFFTSDFKKFLYDNFYKLLDQILEFILTFTDYNSAGINDSIPEIFYGKFNDFSDSYLPRNFDDDIILNPMYGFFRELIDFIFLHLEL